jgi:flagellar basal body rod protein FlgC
MKAKAMYLQIMSHYLQNTHMQSLLQKKRQDYRRKKRSVRLRTEQHRKQRVHLRQPLQVLHSHKAQILPYRIHQAHLQQDQRLQVMQDSL